MQKFEKQYEEAMKRALATKPYIHSDGKLIPREELHDRDAFRENKELEEPSPNED